MDRKKSLLCALVMGAVAAQGNAELLLTARQEADPAPGLQRWIVSGTATAPGEAVVTIAKLRIDGLVHQVQPFDRLFPPAQQTLSTEDLPASSLWNKDWDVLDTHYLVDLNASKQDPDIVTLLGFMQETNDDSDPAGLNLPVVRNPDTEPAVGLGIFEMDDDGAFALQERLRGPNTDLLQVVIPEGTQVTVRAELFGSEDRSGTATLGEVVLPVPEPASAMLIAGLGSVALLRRRR